VTLEAHPKRVRRFGDGERYGRHGERYGECPTLV